MSTPEKSSRIGTLESGTYDERSCLELLLRLQPFPCLVVEMPTARPLLTNEEARRMRLCGPPMAPGTSPCYATDKDGDRIEPEQVVPYLIGRGAGGDGVELTWHDVGCPRSFRIVARTVPNAEGSVPLSVLSFLDLTAQRKAEAELREAVEARDEFFSVATHELKDPLFSIQLSTQLLRHAAEREGPIPPYVLQHLEVSERQIVRLGRLIENMLDFARIHSGRFMLELEPMDLRDPIEQVVARFQGQAATNGTILKAEPGLQVYGHFDRLKIEQVVGNLLSNAIKYGAGRPVSVRLHTEVSTAVIEVEDSGPGIPTEDRARIFERFERASTGHKRASLGLGLYIVRTMVEEHGGTVEVVSEPGRGSTFIVKIPRLEKL